MVLMAALTFTDDTALLRKYIIADLLVCRCASTAAAQCLQQILGMLAADGKLALLCVYRVLHAASMVPST